MCLTLSNETTKPYNDSKTRYKILQHFDTDFGERYISHFKYFSWPLDGSWVIATDGYVSEGQRVELEKQNGAHNIGFHAFVTEEDAKAVLRWLKNSFSWNSYSSHALCVVQLEVDAFVASGVWDEIPLIPKCETWMKARIVKICAS